MQKPNDINEVTSNGLSGSTIALIVFGVYVAFQFGVFVLLALQYMITRNHNTVPVTDEEMEEFTEYMEEYDRKINAKKRSVY